MPSVRDGKNLKGRVLGVVLRTVGKRAVLGKALANTVKAIEGRVRRAARTTRDPDARALAHGTGDSETPGNH